MKIKVTYEFNDAAEAALHLGGSPAPLGAVVSGPTAAGQTTAQKAAATKKKNAAAKKATEEAAALAAQSAATIDKDALLAEVKELITPLLVGPGAVQFKGEVVALVSKHGGVGRAGTVPVENLTAFVAEIKTICAAKAAAPVVEESLI